MLNPAARASTVTCRMSTTRTFGGEPPPAFSLQPEACDSSLAYRECFPDDPLNEEEAAAAALLRHGNCLAIGLGSTELANDERLSVEGDSIGRKEGSTAAPRVRGRIVSSAPVTLMKKGIDPDKGTTCAFGR